MLKLSRRFIGGLATLSLALAATLAPAETMASGVDRIPESGAPLILGSDAREALRGAREFGLAGDRAPDPAVVAASIHYLGTVLALWNPSYSREDATAILGADVFERGVTGGLLAPALYLTEESLLLGQSRIADVTGPIIATLSPSFSPVLSRAGVRTVFPDSVTNSSNSILGIVEYVSRSAPKPRQDALVAAFANGVTIDRFFSRSRRGARTSGRYAVADILAGPTSARESVLAGDPSVVTGPDINQRPGFVTGRSTASEAGCLAICAIKVLGQFPLEIVDSFAKDLAVDTATNVFFPPRAGGPGAFMDEKSLAITVAEAGVQTALSGNTCGQTCHDVAKERADREREELDREKADLDRKDHEHAEQQKALDDAKTAVQSEQERAAAEIKQQELDRDREELDKQREALKKKESAGGYVTEDYVQPKDKNGKPIPTKNPVIRGDYAAGIADAIAVGQSLRDHSSQLSFTERLQRDTTQLRKQLIGSTKPPR